MNMGSRKALPRGLPNGNTEDSQRMRPKARLAAELLRKRLEHADHRLRKLPGERRLAEEMGLSRNTIRAALALLVRDGLLTRKPNGRIAVRRALKANTRVRTIGFLSPAVFSKDHQLWMDGALGSLKGLKAKLRPLTYGHWGDPVIHQALNGMDGLFFVTTGEAFPGWLARKIRASVCRTVVLDGDESAEDLPSVVLFPASAVEKLLRHLKKLGHRAIDCLNTQAENPVIEARIGVWRRFLEREGLSGVLRSAPKRRPVESAYALVRRTLQRGRSMSPAQLCTTGPAAIGAMRAFQEAGLVIGRDVSVCAVNDEGLAPYLLKTLTSLVSPPRGRYLRDATRWMVGSGAWRGPLLIQPGDAALFIGESTGPTSGS